MASTVSLRDLTTEFLLELRDCPVPVGEYHLLRVARKVCEATDAWQEVFEPMPAEPNELVYVISPDSTGAELVRLVSYSMGGVLQWARKEQTQPPPGSARTWKLARFQPDQPPFELDALRTEVTLFEQPTGDLEFAGSLRPRLTATTLPALLRDRHMETLRFGVLSRLMVMGQQPWTDRELGEFYRQRFNAALNADAVTAARGNTQAPLRTRPSPI